MKEEEVLLKAMDVLNDALEGRVIHPTALQCAQSMTIMLWSTVYLERLKSEQIKEALRDVWEEKIGEDVKDCFEAINEFNEKNKNDTRKNGE